MSLVTFALALIAFASLGLATDAQHRRRFGRPPPAARRAALRTVGWLVLGASVLPAILARGWIFGPILWIAAVMAGAAVVFLTLNLLPARTPAPARPRQG